MTDKLSSNKLKEMIGKWLSKPEIRKDLEHHSEMDDPNARINSGGGPPNETVFMYTARLFEAPVNVKTVEQLEEHIWSMWCDGKRWNRESKRMLKNEWVDYLSTVRYEAYDSTLPGNKQKRTQVPYFDIDMLGEANMELVSKFFNDPKQAEKCIHRCFTPNNQLADNYRLEIVTTPDDTAVIGWTVIVD